MTRHKDTELTRFKAQKNHSADTANESTHPQQRRKGASSAKHKTNPTQSPLLTEVYAKQSHKIKLLCVVS